LNIESVEGIFDNILAPTEKIIKDGNRGQILNDQFFHHQFTSLLTKHYVDRRIDPWRRMIIVPGHPTKELYTWNEFGLNRPKSTQKLALEEGVPSRFDFVIRDEPRIHVELKGPNLYNSRDVAKSLTKLLMLEGRKPVKVFSAIVTSSHNADEKHIHELTSRFYEALEFTQVILEIDDIRRTNLYAYIATVPNQGAEKFIWGRV